MTIIPAVQQPNPAYYKPVLQTSLRPKSATSRENAPSELNNANSYTLQYEQQSSGARTSSVSNRIRTALDQSYTYADKINTLPAVNKEKDLGTGSNDFEESGLHMTTNLSSSTPHPEISIDSEGHSKGNKNGIDVRNQSLDEFPDDLINVDIGLSTVPNKYCTVREALELKKLLLLTKGSRGGIVPSSSAVMDMYMVGSVIGVGSYGKVRSAWHRLTGRKVAIKTYDKSRLKDQSHWKRVHSEIKIMETVSHPRVARMYEAVETPKRLHLIMECVEGGNLCSYVKQKKKLHEAEAKKIFFQLMLAIEYLHTENIAHRDIKLENVLFTESRDIKLIDFGFSTISKPGTKMKIFCGTPSYMAPEIVLRTEYEGPPVDLWSAGVLLFACLCGQFPFRAQSYPDLYRRIARGSFAVSDDVSMSAKDLIRSLLCVDPAGRPSPSAVLKHPWLQTQIVSAPDIGKLRHDTIILISENPSDDIDNQAVSEIVRFGISRDEVIRLVMTKTHSSVATLYYLFLDALFAVRQQNGGVAKPSSSVAAQTAAKKPLPDTAAVRKENEPTATQQQQSALATQFLLKSAGGAGVLNLRPRSASATRGTAQVNRPLSANLMRR